MAEKKPVKKKRKKSKGQEHIVTVLKAVSVVLVILILLFIAADRFGNITFSSVGDYVNTVISGTKRGDGYPYYFDSVQVKDVKEIGADIVLISDTSTVVLDSTARKVSEIRHTYSNPLCKSSSGRMILLDVGGTSYRVHSKSKILYEGSTERKILTGAIGKNGTIAVATRGSGAVSELSVYNKNQKEIFNWSCARENIISVDVSDNGKLAAVSVVGAENGELYSKVFIFEFKYAEPVGSFDFGGQIVSDVEFLSGDTLLVSGENVFSVITDKAARNDTDLSLNTLSRIYTDDSNYTVAVLSKYGSSTSKILHVYDRKGGLLFTADIDSTVKSVSGSRGCFSVLTDSKLISYNRKGEMIGTSEVESDGIRCFTDGSYTYVYSMGKISAFKTVGGESADTNTQAVTGKAGAVPESEISTGT